MYSNDIKASLPNCSKEEEYLLLEFSTDLSICTIKEDSTKYLPHLRKK